MSKKIITPSVSLLMSQISSDASPAVVNDKVTTWVNSLPVYPVYEKGMITFLYMAESDDNDGVFFASSANSFRDDDSMIRYGKTRLYYKTLQITNPESFSYYFLVDNGITKRPARDPFNRKIVLDKIRSNTPATGNGKKGTIEAWHNLVPPAKNEKFLRRAVYIYLPPEYYTSPDTRYPVLYMHDGQNIFDTDTANYDGWKIDTASNLLIEKGLIQPAIIVGIENTSKRKEEYVGFAALYKHDRVSYLDSGNVIRDGKEYSESYKDFVVHTVKPLIDTEYRTKPDRSNTFIAGSSFGAGSSFYIALSYPDIFSRAGGLSYGHYNPQVGQWREKPYWVTEFLLDTLVHEKSLDKIYLDCGMKDLDMIFYPRAMEFRDGLVKAGYTEGMDLYFLLDKERGHNEKAWAERMNDFLTFMLGK